MIDVSFREFIVNGNWGPVKLGMSRNDFYNLISPHDNSFFEHITLEEYMDEKIWLYGNVEFYFDSFINSNNCLDMIFCDIFQVGQMINGGDVFQIDEWFTNSFSENPSKIEFESVKNFMLSNSIDFTANYENNYQGVNYSRIEMRFKSGAVLSFDKQEDLFYLRIICLRNKP